MSSRSDVEAPWTSRLQVAGWGCSKEHRWGRGLSRQVRTGAPYLVPSGAAGDVPGRLRATRLSRAPSRCPLELLPACTSSLWNAAGHASECAERILNSPLSVLLDGPDEHQRPPSPPRPGDLTAVHGHQPSPTMTSQLLATELANLVSESKRKNTDLRQVIHGLPITPRLEGPARLTVD